MTTAALRHTTPLAPANQTDLEVSHFVAPVVAVEDDAIVVRVSGVTHRARRAASCLVAPAPGDEAAVVLTGDDRAFVTAVLVAADGRSVGIAVEGDLSIRAGGVLSLASKVMRLSAAEGLLSLTKVSLVSSALEVGSEGIRVAAKSVDGFFDRISQTAMRCYRKVAELDELRAERIDYRTEEEMCLRSENFLVGARKLAKVDAEQIHIG
jgi:hypothetical protein